MDGLFARVLTMNCEIKKREVEQERKSDSNNNE